MSRMVAPKVIQQPIVVSVPHSATRTLVAHLGLKTHQHFMYNQPPNLQNDKLVHVPIRHPMDVAESWARRKKDVNQLLARYACMFKWLEKHEPTFHRMEDLPRLAGTEDTDVVEGNLAIVKEYQEIVMREVVEPNMGFFAGFYTDRLTDFGTSLR